MKILKSFEFPVSTVGKATHDWDTILDGQLRQLEQGVDFKCKVETFNTLARNAAKKRGLSVRTSKVEGGLVLQAHSGGASGTDSTGEASPGEPATKAKKGKK